MQKRDCSQRVKCVPSPMVENNALWWSCVDRNYFTIILQSSVGRGEAHFRAERPPENLPPISKSADLSRKVPNPLNPDGIPVTLYVVSRHRIQIGTFLEMSAEFEIGGRFSGRPLSSEVSLSPPHTRL